MIKEQKITLRAIEPADIDLLYSWENNLDLWQVSNTLVPFSRYQLKKYIESSALDIYQTRQLRLMIDFTEQGTETVGMIDLFDFDPYHNRAGTGIMIHQKWRKRGIADKALKLFIQYCFDKLKIHQLYCNISSDNHVSIQLFQNNGFEIIGTKKEWIKIKDGFKDELMLQIINTT